jgi:pimeloyl-ACP methyl ester carboxylesterase
VPQFVTDDGVRIVYQMWNRPTVLPPLVLHHGFTGGATCDWVETGVVAALTAANRTVIAPDARGHGGSDKPHQPSAYGEARMACDLIQLIDTLALPRIDLLGFSMGAVVTLLAATTDQRIRRLAIVGVGAGVVELGSTGARSHRTIPGRSSRSWPATTAPRSPIPNSPHASSTSWGTALPRRDGSSYD